MNDRDSVTVWLNKLKEGSRDVAVGRLWQRYFERMVGLARNHLHARPRPAADEEDVALAAFDSFVRAAQRGAFPNLNDRNELWRVLFKITRNKALHLVEKDNAAKRGQGNVVHVSALAGDEPGLSREPDPLEAVALAEGLDQMLDLLVKPDLRQVALWRMEGHSNQVIAEKLGRSLPAVERKLKAIRTIYHEADIWVE